MAHTSNPPQNPSQTPGQTKQAVGEVAYNVEFNDSVLSTQTWNNPRYNGSKTETQVLNKFTEGDITYGKRPSVQNYSRNIYIGERIIGYFDDLYLDLSHTLPNTGSFNTGKYTGFPDWSFVVFKESYTINEDDTIEQAKKYEVIENESSDGLSREFKQDFLVGTKCNILDFSENIDPTTGLASTPRLEAQYTVQFNKGLLGKIAEGVANDVDYRLSVGTPSSGGGHANKFIFNRGLTGDYGANAFFIQDSSSFNTFYTDVSGSGYINNAASASEFFNILGERERDLGEKYAIKFYSTSSEDSAFVSNLNGFESKLIYELSGIKTVPSGDITAKIKNTATIPLQIENDEPSAGKTSFISKALGNDNFILYRVNEAFNAIIIDLPRKRDLPGGIDKFVILPENIHPYIKDNINYFVSQIGLYNSNQSFTINPKNRQLS